MLGYTLVTCGEPFMGTGTLTELDRAKRERWQIAGLAWPTCVQALPGNRILIAETNSSMVTERDFKGNILWQKACPSPFSCQRLANGNTFIATANELLELDRSGREVFNYKSGDITAGYRFKNGKMGYVNYSGQYILIAPSGKRIKSAQISPIQEYGAGFDFLPNEHLIQSLTSSNEVVEYDSDGKIVWRASVQRPTSATRLPNGNTLVASQQKQNVTEINRAGKIVWELSVSGRPTRAYRR